MYPIITGKPLADLVAMIQVMSLESFVLSSFPFQKSSPSLQKKIHGTKVSSPILM
jgi:hypothetical protein